jgi:glycine/D-amino acid oxidase-like deaminating enzyme
MLGLTLAPLTGELVADLVQGTDREELSVLDPRRLGWTHRRTAGTR